MQTCRIYKECGDALEAERIAAQAKKVVRKPITRGSGAHNIQPLALTSYAFCVIEKPLRGVTAGKQKKSSK